MSEVTVVSEGAGPVLIEVSAKSGLVLLHVVRTVLELSSLAASTLIVTAIAALGVSTTPATTTALDLHGMS